MPPRTQRIRTAFDSKAADACGSLRAGPPIATVGDGDKPTSTKTYAPICYKLGKAILVVEYEMEGTQCTRLVGVSLARAL